MRGRRTGRRAKRATLWGLSVGAVLLVLAAAWIATPSPTRPEPAGEAQTEPLDASQAASRAYRNPVTGELTVPPPGASARSGRSTAPTPPPVEVQMPDGIKTRVRGRFMSANVVRLHPDGTLVPASAAALTADPAAEGAGQGTTENR